MQGIKERTSLFQRPAGSAISITATIVNVAAIATFPTKVEAGTVFVQVGGANAAGELTYDEDDGAACADDGACDQGGGKAAGAAARELMEHTHY